MKTKDITFIGMLLAVAFVLSYLESLLPIFIEVPGMKIGLANICTMIILYRYNAKYAFAFMVVRVLISCMIFTGFSALPYGICGGVFCIIIMRFTQNNKYFSLLGVSIFGAVFHNLGQITVAFLIFSNYRVLYYYGMLFISAVIGGIIVGIISNIIMKRANILKN